MANVGFVREVGMDGRDQEIEPVTVCERQHCSEDRPHPAHAQHMVAHCMLGDGTLAMPWYHGAIA